MEENGPITNAILEFITVDSDRRVERFADSYDLVCVVSGSCVYRDGDAEVEVDKNCIRILTPGSRVVEYRVGSSGHFEKVLMHIDRDALFGRVEVSDRDEQRFESAILSGISSNVSIEDLASMCCYSVSTFKRRFRGRYGMSPHRWMLRCRLDIAARILGEARLPINVIAALCGFINVSHFIATFRRRFGDTPSHVMRRRYSRASVE